MFDLPLVISSQILHRYFHLLNLLLHASILLTVLLLNHSDIGVFLSESLLKLCAFLSQLLGKLVFKLALETLYVQF